MTESPSSILAFATSRARAVARRDEFARAQPFPHAVIDGLLPPEVAAAMAAEFEHTDGTWIHYHHATERKRGFNDVERMGRTSRAVVAALNSPAFVATLEALTGIRGLLPDPALDGGGLHETGPGGFLNVHTDFLSHPTQRSWTRQVNLLLFLNADWSDAYEGALELWDATGARCVRSIAPLFNRCVVFRTSVHSYHGVPTPLACPPDRRRKSLALYYFTDEGHPLPLAPTHYVARPDDPVRRRLLVRLDGWLLWTYALLKRYTPLGDRVVTKLLKRL